jgi:hypothetical protein
MKPDSFTYSKCCWFCVSLKTERIDFDTAEHTCELHNFKFDYPGQIKERVCLDYLDEDEVGNE